MIPTGPTIPESVSFDNNYTRVLKTDSLIFTEIMVPTGTVGAFSTLSTGRLTNINDPILNSDIATKHYADLYTPGGIVSEPLNSIQFNNAGQFDGSADLTYNVGTNVLYSKLTTVGTGSTMLTIGSGTMLNISAPVSGQDAVSKSYVDNTAFCDIIGITTGSATYTGPQMVNTIIYRTGAVTSDTTADSATLVPLINGSCRFSVYNGTSGSFDLVAGTGILVYPTCSSISIKSGYTLNAFLSVSGSTVLMLVESLVPGPSTGFIVGPRSTYATVNTTKVSSTLSTVTNPIILTSQNVIYGPTTINGTVYRNFNGPKTDSFGPVSSFISGFAYPNSPVPYIPKSGAVELIIKNTSTSGSVTLVGSSEWTMDVNSNVTIGIGKTGYFYLRIDTVELLGYIYVIGIFDTV
jgi:hypothetical protein